jgi:hypothetical protein
MTFKDLDKNPSLNSLNISNNQIYLKSLNNVHSLNNQVCLKQNITKINSPSFAYKGSNSDSFGFMKKKKHNIQQNDKILNANSSSGEMSE